MNYFLARLKLLTQRRHLPSVLVALMGVTTLLASAPSSAATPHKAPTQVIKPSTKTPESKARKPDAEHAPLPVRTRTLTRKKKASTKDLSTAELEVRARARELGGQDYPYHKQSRKLRGTLKCPQIKLIEYDGSVVPYNQTIEINPYFKERLVRFERIVAEVAVEVYGRAPAKIIHLGGHTCKSIGGRRKTLSEHAYGHAIDIKGFEFEAVDGDAMDPVDGAFTVDLKKHWHAKKGFEARHREFLRALADALKKRGPFSLMLGPAYKGHDRLFHFDFGPQFFFRI